ncbi:dUTP diphosphatase [Mycoplasmoides pirum]|uniref:dUTP diphosphatase n=1 Tax=Mycoplasmoides pirum TaxID=2122 RepID=UPI0004819831|nr:dUTP diphosphatase [Mycoplasmoides pirum]
MIWDFNKLIVIQKELDKKIFKKFHTQYKSTSSKRKLALIVELCELANEIRFFKFWSTKSSSELKIILDELADVFHFAFTFAIQYKSSNVYNIPNIKKDKKNINSKLTIYFSSLIKLAQNIKDKKTIDLFIKQLIKLSIILGFNKKQIFEAYLLKNEINLQRNKSNY